MNASVGSDAIKGLAAKLQGMLELAALLDEIGSLDNAAAEARTRMEAARVAEQQAVADMTVAVAARDSAMDEAANVITKANAEAMMVRQAADEAAKAVRDKAESDASLAVGSANAHVRHITEAANKVRDEAIAAANQARAERDALQTQINAMRPEVESLEGRLAAAKAAGAKAIADALGG